MKSVHPPLRLRHRAQSRLVAVFASGAVASVLLAGCASEDPAVEGDTAVVIAISSDPQRLDAGFTTVQSELNVASQIQEKLFELTPDGTDYEPRLAESWEMVDEDTVRFTLREGVTFTNGEPFNAESAAFSFNEVMPTQLTLASYMNLVEPAVVIDDYTIEFSATTGPGLLLSALSKATVQYPVEYFTEVGAEAFGEEPIGTGPYVLDSWTKSQSIVMSANTEYWGGEPAIDDVTFQIIPDKSSQIAALQSGQADFMTDVPLGAVSQVEDSDELQFVTAPSARVFSILMNTFESSVLSDPDLRRALWHAIDTESIVEQQLGGLGAVLDSQLVGNTYFGYDEDREPIEYDPELAREMLAEAGYGDGVELEFVYPSGRYPQDLEIGQAISAQLTEVGVTVQQSALEPGAFFARLGDPESNDLLFVGGLTLNDSHFQYQQFRTGAPYTFQSSPAYDALIAAELAETDPEERLAIFAELADVVEEEVPLIPLYQGTDTYLLTARVDGFEPAVSQLFEIAKMSIRN